MLNFRFSFVFIFIIAALSSPFGTANGQDSLQEIKDSVAKPSMAGLWKVEAERTNQANATSRKAMNPETIEQLNSMTLQLNLDGRFEQTIGDKHKITGKWDFDFGDANEGSRNFTGRLTLDSDNLENHAEMHFDIVFIQPNLIEAHTTQGIGTVFFTKEVPQETSVADSGSRNQQADSEIDKAAEMFAGVAGCLGARSMEKDGVQISFVWFEDRDAIVSWCKSRKHAGTATRLMQMADPEIKMREPLDSAPDEHGPFLVIMTLKPKENRDDGFPLEQLSMEIYKPVNGGMFIGKRFAPEELVVNGLREILPK